MPFVLADALEPRDIVIGAGQAAVTFHLRGEQFEAYQRVRHELISDQVLAQHNAGTDDEKRDFYERLGMDLTVMAAVSGWDVLSVEGEPVEWSIDNWRRFRDQAPALAAELFGAVQQPAAVLAAEGNA